MPSGRNQAGRATAAQLKIFMFGYLARAWTRARFQARSFASAQGPDVTCVRTFTQSTGWPRATDIIRAILAARPTREPAATSALSLVPSANTQQPRKPAAAHALATPYPFTWPGRASTTDRPPEASISRRRTPTAAYLAGRRCAGSGRNDGEIRSTDVESPMCATDRQEVRGARAAAAPPGATARP